MFTQRLSVFLFTCFVTMEACVAQKEFKTDVKTTKKPWTNLQFNNNPNNFQFAIVSDRFGGGRPGIFEDAVGKVNMMQPEFVMSIGDLISGYTTDTSVISKQWNEFNGIISGLQMPFFYLPGNHDITNKVMEKEWEKRFGSRYYSFTYKNTLFITLDSNDDDDHNLTQKQTDFVLDALKKNQGVRWTFIFMHHPIWTYDTGGRFNKIEEALKGRKFTVLAGHEHRYQHAERNGSNYYILSTTGGGSALRGNYFGEFDHISWVTMTDNGPVMANLRLDGILPHTISNEKTEEMANSLMQNARLTKVLLCNKGETFTNGTLYLTFKNPTDSRLKVNIDFFHHHQLQIKQPHIQLTVEPGGSPFVEIPINSDKPLDYKAIDLLLFDWQIKYDTNEYPNFALHGKNQLEVRPTKTTFIDKDIAHFVDKNTVAFQHPFTNLDTRFSLNNVEDRQYSAPIELEATGELSFFLKNGKNEYTAPEGRVFEKTPFLEPMAVANPKDGMEYRYYEGKWGEWPDFDKMESKTGGIAKNFLVSDIASREDYWGLVYNGYLKAEVDSFYVFRIQADDACRLYIDNKLVVSEKKSSKGENVGAVALKKGFHRVRVEFIEQQGDARLRFYTKSPDNDWKLLEKFPFFH